MRINKPYCDRGHKRTPESLASNHQCRQCKQRYGLEYYYKNKDKLKQASRNGRIKREYGVDIRWYEETFKAQNGVCAICSKPQEEGIASLAIDHNHETGAVRGLLCRACNRGLGVFKESVSTLDSAIKYLCKYS